VGFVNVAALGVYQIECGPDIDNRHQNIKTLVPHRKLGDASRVAAPGQRASGSGFPITEETKPTC
jgi:hypothetical protein